MKIIFTFIILFSFSSFGKTALQYAREMENEVDNETCEFSIIKDHADKAINAALMRAITQLRQKGNFELAEEVQTGWELNYGASLFQSRNIGDHAPVNKWLSDEYNKIEFFLGQNLCKVLHISDIKTLNNGIPVVIRPVTFPMDNVTGDRIDEYRRHFAGGPSGNDSYYGVIPVLIYWTTNIGLTAAGGPVISSLVASIAERLMDIAAAGLSDRVFNRFNKETLCQAGF